MLARYSVKLTPPFISSLDKILSKTISGRFNFKNIGIKLNFTEIEEELGLKIKTPTRLKLQAYSFFNKNANESQSIIVEVKLKK